MYREIYNSFGCSGRQTSDGISRYGAYERPSPRGAASSRTSSGRITSGHADTDRAAAGRDSEDGSSGSVYGLFRADAQTVEAGQDVCFGYAEATKGLTLSDDGTTVRVSADGVYRIDFGVMPLTSSGAVISPQFAGVREDGEAETLGEAGQQVTGISLVRLKSEDSVELRVADASEALGVQLRAYLCIMRID